MPNHESPQTKAERRDAARAEALALRAAQERKDKRNRLLALGALVVALVALFAIIGVVIFNGRNTSTDSGTAAPTGPVTTPATANKDGGFPVGADGTVGTTNEGAVVVDVYLDYLCPVCAQFESTNGPALDDLRTSGDVTVVYHPIAILDHLSSGTVYSTRSAAAGAYVAVEAPKAFVAFTTAMFADQPKENSSGLTNEEIAKIAKDAGASADVAAKISDGTAATTYGSWVTAQSDADGANPDLKGSSGSFGTPTILINGKILRENWRKPGVLTDAINAAAGK